MHVRIGCADRRRLARPWFQEAVGQAAGPALSFSNTNGNTKWAAVPAQALLLGILLLATGCAGIIVGVPTDLQTVKSVGVISAFADRFQLRKLGVTVFGNDESEFPVDSWGIDDVMAGKVRTLLGRRFDVRPVTYRRAAFAKPNRDGIGAMVRDAVTPAAVDAYVVVTRGTSRLGATNQFVNGLGLLEASGGLLYSNRHFVYALYAVSIIDAREFSSKAVTVGLMPGEALVDPLRSTAMRGPHKQVDESWWPTARDAASNQRLKGAVVELIDQSLPNTLQQLQLVN
jgi:hypothetical protein